MGVYKFHATGKEHREHLIFKHIKEGCDVIKMDEDFLRAGTSFRMGLNLIKLGGGLPYLKEFIEKVDEGSLEADQDAEVFLNTDPQYGLLRVDGDKFK